MAKRKTAGASGDDRGRKDQRPLAMKAAREPMKRKDYDDALQELQVDLSALRDRVKHKGLRIVVVFEGRDAAGKGGTIKALTERVSPRVFPGSVSCPHPAIREKLSSASSATSPICRPRARS